ASIALTIPVFQNSLASFAPTAFLTTSILVDYCNGRRSCAGVFRVYYAQTIANSLMEVIILDLIAGE
ncbi:MAG: hypothetical protein LM517_06400, partial [Nitrosomonas sp.]|nr:hypothetical protein [Nitrosomonas sp.]